MADKPTASATPGFSPKAVHIGGESIVDRVLPHIKKIVIVIGVITVILSVIFTRQWWVERGQTKETVKLANVLAIAQQPIRAKDAPPDPKDPKDGSGSGSDASFTDPSDRANKILSAITTNEIDPGPLYRAGLLLDAGKLDDAIAEYRKAVATLADLDGVMAREGLGIALEQKALAEKDSAASQKILEEALETFVSMQPDPEGPRYAYAMYHQGRILSNLQKKDEAKAAFEKAKESAKDSSDELPELIEKRLAALAG